MSAVSDSSGGYGTFSLGASGGHGFGLGHSIATTTGLRTILCRSLVPMPRVKFVEKCMHGICMLKSL